MPGANPLMEAGATTPPATNAEVGYEPPAASSGPANSGFAGAGRMLNGGFSGIDNTSSHVAILVGGAGLLVAFLYFGGFSFGVDAGVMRK